MIKVVSLDSVERNIALIPAANQTWCARESCGLETGSIQNMRQRGKKKKNTHTKQHQNVKFRLATYASDFPVSKSRHAECVSVSDYSGMHNEEPL